MIKVISFSLWGDKKMYTIGAIKNADLAKQFYPDFQCWFYIHKATVPQNIIDELKKKNNVKIILKEGDLINENCKPRMWRFEAIDNTDVEFMLCRDTDTRILLREKLAVEEWINSNKIFHIMRDHPHHGYNILAGMFGTRKITNIVSWVNLINNYIKQDNRMYDQDFLKEYIYPIIKDDCIIHSSFQKWEKQTKPFPIPYDDDYRFVGEYVYEDETRSQQHIDILKNSL